MQGICLEFSVGILWKMITVSLHTGALTTVFALADVLFFLLEGVRIESYLHSWQFSLKLFRTQPCKLTLLLFSGNVLIVILVQQFHLGLRTFQIVHNSLLSTFMHVLTTTISLPTRIESMFFLDKIGLHQGPWIGMCNFIYLVSHSLSWLMDDPNSRRQMEAICCLLFSPSHFIFCRW